MLLRIRCSCCTHLQRPRCLAESTDDMRLRVLVGGLGCFGPRPAASCVPACAVRAGEEAWPRKRMQQRAAGAGVWGDAWRRGG